ncbi:ABC transporter [Chromobacterium phragmitis]|uniref:ABC transporter n=1 Tax=Chromobacterium phragmitis TaxID=2202141 RepID=A0A344UIH4_9NEIS|nr:VacJ family lipoprotein [Chromobacterium phragmitis]AXE29681.1 ABC transporter [Chromobacterium phragmitis]AXE35072.1 ABC transporter [Chromobacterium phragmitis]
MRPVQLLAAATLLALAGCASNPTTAYDPYEPYNRAMFTVNDKADQWVIKPVAQGYQTVVPSPIRTGVGNFFDNLKDVYSFAFNILRAEPEKAANDFMRVAMNTGFGLFGLIDVATPAGLKNNKTSLGDVMSAWGWKSSSYFVLPFFGPSTVRDSTGLATSLAGPGPEKLVYHNTNEAIAFYSVYGISTRARYLGAESLLDTAAVDRYSYTRDLYMQLRAKQLGQPDPTQPVDNFNLDDLMSGGDSSAPAGERKAAASEPAAVAASAAQ